MSTLSMPTLAGLTATVVFAVSTVPMLALMLGWYVRYGLRRQPHRPPEGMGGSPDAPPSAALLASGQSKLGGDP